MEEEKEKVPKAEDIKEIDLSDYEGVRVLYKEKEVEHKKNPYERLNLLSEVERLKPYGTIEVGPSIEDNSYRGVKKNDEVFQFRLGRKGLVVVRINDIEIPDILRDGADKIEQWQKGQRTEGKENISDNKSEL